METQVLISTDFELTLTWKIQSTAEERKAYWHYSDFTEKNSLIDMTIPVLGIACRLLVYIT